MSDKTKIAWTGGGATWNPVDGCSKISLGCLNCFAEMMWQGMGREKYKNGFTPTIHPECLNEPLSWKKPRMVFVVSMGDLFHRDIPFDFIDKVMDVIEQCPQHTFQILTKRTERMVEYFSK